MSSTFPLEIERGERPLHVAIAEQLSHALDDGSLTPGTKLPPERELAEMLGVSRMTVRQALGELERAGRLRRVVGRAGGTFVCEPRASTGVAATSGLSAELRRHGGATRAEVVSAGVEPAGRRSAAALELKRGDKVTVITRLHLAGSKPLAVERTTVPAALFPDIEDMDLSGSLVALMARIFDVHVAHTVERLELTTARPSDARALGVRRDSPLFLVERTRSTADDTAVEFSRERFRPDRTAVVLESTVGE